MGFSFELLAVYVWISRQGVQREVPGHCVTPFVKQTFDSQSLVQLVAQSNHKPLGSPDALTKVAIWQPARSDNHRFCRRTSFTQVGQNFLEMAETWACRETRPG
jgi:hypothetical protein